MPGDSQGQPWRIQRVHTTGIEREDEHDVGSGSEADPEIAENKVESLKQQQDEAYECAVVGTVHSILLQAAQKPSSERTSKQKVNRRQDMTMKVLDPKDFEAAEFRLSSIAAILSESDDGTPAKKHKKTGTSNRKMTKTTGTARTARTAGQPGQPSATGTFAALPASQAQGISDAPIKLDPVTVTPTKEQQGREPQDRPPVAPVGQSPCASESPQPSDRVAGETPKPSKSGRKEAQLDVLARQLWHSLMTCEEGSIFFGEKSLSQQRSLARYSNIAGQKILTEKSAQMLQGWRLAKKKFEVMEQLVKIYIQWSKRKGADAAAAAFNFSWDAMLQYCAYTDTEVPAVVLQCPFMYDLRIQVQIASNNVEQVALALTSADLKKNFTVDEEEGDALTLQVKYICQAMTASLTQGRNLGDCKASLLALKKTLIANEQSYEVPVIEDLKKFAFVLDPPLTNFDTENIIAVKGALAHFDDSPGNHQVADEMKRPYFTTLLTAYPKFGSGILKEARTACAKLTECESFSAGLETAKSSIERFLEENVTHSAHAAIDFQNFYDMCAANQSFLANQPKELMLSMSSEKPHNLQARTILYALSF